MTTGRESPSPRGFPGSPPMRDIRDVRIGSYYPGVIGRIVQAHAIYYHRHWGFDISFETQVGCELSDFMRRLVPGRDGFWTAGIHGEFLGAVAIDGGIEDPDGVRLRWFIVEEEYQGLGAGTLLLREAMDFCTKTGRPDVFLWTFEGLDLARKLYERVGFVLSEEHKVEQWGSVITEQKFVRRP
ncbi:MAG: GNAT family N-acetyltransferase [Pseudomonadota bacterium]